MVEDHSTYEVSLDENLSNIKSILLSEIGREIEYIKLETITESLLKSIDQIELCDSFIFVSDRKKLIQFNNKGKFIRQIGAEGRGPGEFIYIRDFCIDENRRLIFILNSGSKQVIVYDFRGHFSNTFDLPTQQSQIALIGDSSLFFHVPNTLVKIDAAPLSWIITDRNGNVRKLIQNSLKRTSFPGYIVLEAPAIYSLDNKIRFMEFGIDTMYMLNVDYSQSKYATFKLEDLKMDPDPLLNSIESKEQLSDKFWIYSVIEQKDFFFIKINWGINIAPENCFFDKRTNEVIFPENGIFINDIDFGADFWPHQIINDSLLIDFLDPLEILNDPDTSISENLISIKQSLTETSNPVIMILHSL